MFTVDQIEYFANKAVVNLMEEGTPVSTVDIVNEIVLVARKEKAKIINDLEACYEASAYESEK